MNLRHMASPSIPDPFFNNKPTGLALTWADARLILPQNLANRTPPNLVWIIPLNQYSLTGGSLDTLNGRATEGNKE